MSNERIDLTQFENFEDFATAPWVVSPEEAQVVIIPANHEAMEEMRLYTGSMTNSMAIAKVPELIAELKRCYEELDKWTNYATYIENLDMDCHKDASAEAGFLWKCTDCGAHFELPENGIYECEFGCDASE